MELGVHEGFIFRGGVALGEVIFDHDRNIVLSEEFNELTKFEASVDMPGCVIMESARQVVLNAIFGEKTSRAGIVPLKSLPMTKFDVPLKSKFRKEDDEIIEIKENVFSWVVNFTYFLSDAELHNLVKSLSGDKNKKINFNKYLDYIGLLPEDSSNDIILDQRIYDLRVMKHRSGARIAFRNRFIGVSFIPVDWSYPKLFSSTPQLTITKDELNSKLNIKAVGSWYD